MIKDKEEKLSILKDLLKQMSKRVADEDFKPKAKMVVKAEGDTPEEAKANLLKGLEKVKLPDPKEMAEMSNSMMEEDEEECAPEMEEEGEDDFLSELPESMREAILKKMKK